MTDSRQSESPPSNHSSLLGGGPSGTVRNRVGGAQYDSLPSFVMQQAAAQFMPPLNMAPIYPTGMKPQPKPMMPTSTDLGPPMFQIPLNLGPPTSGLQKASPVASNIMSHSSLPSMNPIFLSNTPNPNMYPPRTFMMSYTPHYNPTMPALSHSMDNTTAPKAVAKLVPSAFPLSPSPPLASSGKKHQKIVSRPHASSLSTQQKASCPLQGSASAYNASELAIHAPFVSPSSSGISGGGTDGKVDLIAPKNSVNDTHLGREGKGNYLVGNFISSKSSNYFAHSGSVKNLQAVSVQDERQESRERRPENFNSGASILSGMSDNAKFDPNQLLTFYNSKKEPGAKQLVNSVNQARTLEDSKEMVRKTLGLPSDASANSSDLLRSVEGFRNRSASPAGVPTTSGGGGGGRSSSSAARGPGLPAQHALPNSEPLDEAERGVVGRSPAPSHAQWSAGSGTAVMSPPVPALPHPLHSKPTAPGSPSTSPVAAPVPNSKLPNPAATHGVFPSTASNSIMPSSSSVSSSSSGTSVGSVASPCGPVVPLYAPNPLCLPHSPRPSSAAACGLVSPVSTPPRPSILRKRPNDKRSEPLSPTSSRIHSLSAGGLPFDNLKSGSDSNMSASETSEMQSPRKKPRKQNMLTTEDHFSSAIPTCSSLDTGLGSLACSNEDMPPSPDCSPAPCPAPEAASPDDRQKPSSSTAASLPAALARTLPADRAHFQSSLHLLAKIKRPPILGGYRVHSKACSSHFWRYSEFRVKEQSKPTVMSIAQKNDSRHRVKGWRVARVNNHMETMVSNEEEIKVALSAAQDCLSRLLASDTSSDSGSSSIGTTLAEIIQGNFDRSNCVIGSVKQAQGVLEKIQSHKSKALELVEKCAPDAFSLEMLANRTQNCT